VRNRIGCETSEIADVGATVDGSVGVENFGVEAGLWDADEVAFADDWSGVHDDGEKIGGIFSAPKERENAVVGVIGVEPFEPVPVEIDLMERGLGGVEPVKVRDKTKDAPVGVMLQEMPIHAASFTPFLTLGKFLTHEKEFLAGMGVLIGEQEAEIGKLLPEVARHFVQERLFSVNNFVVGKREKEIFAEGVEKRESETVVLVLAVNGIGGKIF